MRPRRSALPWIALALALSLPSLAARPARAHAMPVRSSPAAGATLPRAPTSVRIFFDDALEAGRCTLRVEDSHGGVVSRGPGRVDAKNPRLLDVALKPLAPGTYHVMWIAVSRDGHRTEGDYRFTVSP